MKPKSKTAIQSLQIRHSRRLWTESNGVDRGIGNFHNYQRIKYIEYDGQKKAMIVRANHTPETEEHTYYGYYPSPPEAKILVDALDSIYRDSPGHDMPGSFGVICTIDNPDLIRIRFIQGSFSYENYLGKRNKDAPLTKKMIFNHVHWQDELLDHVFQTASSQGKTKVSFYLGKLENKKMEAFNRKQAKRFLEAAKRNGFKRVRGAGAKFTIVVEKK